MKYAVKVSKSKLMVDGVERTVDMYEILPRISLLHKLWYLMICQYNNIKSREIYTITFDEMVDLKRQMEVLGNPSFFGYRLDDSADQREQLYHINHRNYTKVKTDDPMVHVFEKK